MIRFISAAARGGRGRLLKISIAGAALSMFFGRLAHHVPLVKVLCRDFSDLLILPFVL